MTKKTLTKYPAMKKCVEKLQSDIEDLKSRDIDTVSRIYISGSVTNVSNYMEQFAKAQKKLEEQGYSVINPALIGSNMPKDTTYEEYMKMSFTMLDMADNVYMLKGWQQSLGCNREYGYALGKDKTIIFE